MEKGKDNVAGHSGDFTLIWLWLSVTKKGFKRQQNFGTTRRAEKSAEFCKTKQRENPSHLSSFLWPYIIKRERRVSLLFCELNSSAQL